MNKEVFNKLIQTPAKVDPKHKGDLKQLIDTFPYSANIRLLYLSALINDADVLFEQELKKTAAYITDRSILKKLIEPSPTKEDYIIEEVALEVVKEETITEDTSTPANLTKVEEPAEETISPAVDLKTEKESEEKTESEGTSFSPKEEEEQNTEAEAPQKIDELDELIISSAVNASLSMEIDEIAEEIKSDKNNTNQSEVEGLSGTERSNEVENQTDVPKSFLEWIGGTEVQEIKPQLDPKEQERIEFRIKAESLIDQFIQNQPKIKPKTEFYSPENMAQKSIEDSEEIVTETLAKVYATQGNIAKAKSIYEQLILNNPEKKSYFASLLEKLGKE